MKTIATRRQQGQRGVAAVELALIIPILLVLMTLPLFYGRVMYHYSAGQKAAHDAARYISTISQTEMKSEDLMIEASKVARQIIDAEMSDLPLSRSPWIDLQCDGSTCIGNDPLPSTVRVLIRFRIKDEILGAVDTGDNGLLLTADITLPYVGK